jgi:peptidoglycan/xylan/chitin deacetylase (PgdA/CDA1 family)
MAAAGGAAAFASNTLDTASIRWGIQSGLSGGVVDFGPLWYAEKQTKPVVTFSFDDSNKTDITHAKPILDRYGFRATTHTIAADVGGTNKLTVADLHALYNAGWDVGVHGSYSHADTLITKSAIYADVKMNQDFLVANGLPRSTSYAYPEGDFLPASIQVMRELGFKCAGSVHATPMPINFQNPLRYSRSGTSGKTAAALKLEVDSVITRSGALDFFTHGLYGSGGIHTTEDIFEELVEYVAEKHEAGQLEGGFTMGEYIR